VRYLQWKRNTADSQVKCIINNRNKYVYIDSKHFFKFFLSFMLLKFLKKVNTAVEKVCSVMLKKLKFL